VDDDPVLLEVKGGVAVISLNRPDAHNVMGDAVDALFFRYLDLVRTDRDVRVVVWRGNGPSFSTGRDMAELVGERNGNGNGDADGANGPAIGAATGTGQDHGVQGDMGPGFGRRRERRHGYGSGHLEVLERGHWGTRLLYDFPVPIVCALKGWSLGTAFERALLCDIRVAAESAKMALSAVDHGVIPDSGGVAKLYEIGGASLALDLALTGRHVDAPEALRLGLVSRVVPDDDLDDAALDLAHGIAERPPLVTRLVREHVQALASPGVRGTLGRELVSQTMLLGSDDFEEHRQARAEDREPRYERR
jgi:enoyl-CoA hydratase/carnithine racemase